MNYYEEIKNKIIEDEAYEKVKDYSKERHKVITNYEIGKLLFDAGKHYGKNIIGEYSKKLQVEVNKKYNERTLYRMKKLYEVFSDTKLTTMLSILTWSHYLLLIQLKSCDEIIYYINLSKSNNLTKRGLEERIKSKEYERLPKETKDKLIKNEELNVKDIIPNPIIINNKNDIEVVTEKVLKNLILDNIESFIEQLGIGFSFIKSEYKIKIGDSYNYIDLLLFNIEFSCYVVIELKVTELKKEHIGQIQVYMNYIDNNLRRINQDKTIGIIICKKDNKFIMEYCSDNRIISKEYLITHL